MKLDTWVPTLFVLLLACVLCISPARADFEVPGGILFSHEGYNYAPSMFQDGNTQYFWWCGYGQSPSTGVSGDVIWYSSVNLNTYVWTTPQRVLWPDYGQWDSALTCDPSVIAGSFNVPGIGGPYSYAMYYGGTDRADGTNTRVGVAFSNDLVNWVKYPGNPVISPQCPVTQQGCPTSTYGAGNPSTYSDDGVSRLRIFYTDTSTGYGNRVWISYTSDGIHFSAPKLVSNQGTAGGIALTSNADFAQDWSAQAWYAIVPDRLRTGDRERFSMTLYTMSDAQFDSGNGLWQPLGTIDSNLTGYYLNHSPGFWRDKYGNLTGQLPAVELYFAEGTDDPNTWQLTWVKWFPQPNSLSFDRYYSSSQNLHWVSAGYVPTGVGYYYEQTLGYLLMAPQPGMSGIYGCHGSYGGLYQFVSTDPNCEGQFVNGLNGYLYTSQPDPNVIPTQALYRCRSGADHFVSPDPYCEGTVTEYLLGYAQTSQ